MNIKSVGTFRLFGNFHFYIQKLYHHESQVERTGTETIPNPVSNSMIKSYSEEPTVTALTSTHSSENMFKGVEEVRGHMRVMFRIIFLKLPYVLMLKVVLPSYKTLDQRQDDIKSPGYSPHIA